MKLLKLFVVLVFFTAMNLSCSKPVNDCLGPKGNYVSDVDSQHSSSLGEQRQEAKFKNVLVDAQINHDLTIKIDSSFAVIPSDRY